MTVNDAEYRVIRLLGKGKGGYSYQQEILDKLEAERTVRGYTRNLVVAATGTGKTVISALDYKRFRKQNPDRPCRLLFVAHREEILKQSLYTFRACLLYTSGTLKVAQLQILKFPVVLPHKFLDAEKFNLRFSDASEITEIADKLRW